MEGRVARSPSLHPPASPVSDSGKSSERRRRFGLARVDGEGTGDVLNTSPKSCGCWCDCSPRPAARSTCDDCCPSSNAALAWLVLKIAGLLSTRTGSRTVLRRLRCRPTVAVAGDVLGKAKWLGVVTRSWLMPSGSCAATAEAEVAAENDVLSEGSRDRLTREGSRDRVVMSMLLWEEKDETDRAEACERNGVRSSDSRVRCIVAEAATGADVVPSSRIAIAGSVHVVVVADVVCDPFSLLRDEGADDRVGSGCTARWRARPAGRIELPVLGSGCITRRAVLAEVPREDFWVENGLECRGGCAAGLL